jgi:hypothetical protein
MLEEEKELLEEEKELLEERVRELTVQLEQAQSSKVRGRARESGVVSLWTHSLSSSQLHRWQKSWESWMLVIWHLS